MPWTWYRTDGSVKGVGAKGDLGRTGAAGQTGDEGPEGPEAQIIEGPRGLRGFQGLLGPMLFDSPDPPDEPLIVPGPIGLVSASLRRIIEFGTAGAATYTPDPGTTAFLVEWVGGGGGGAGAEQSAVNAGVGGGGQGGSRKIALYTAPIAPTYAVTVGAGGTGGATGPNDGGTGAASIFDGVSAPGGNGGKSIAGGATAAIAHGGAHNVATQVDQGGVGGPGFRLATGAGQVIGGFGGSSRFNGGTPARINADGLNGLRGAGGSGASSIAGSANRPGGPGGSGFIRIYEFG